MIENIYIIYDRAAGIALKPPLIHRNDVAPVRELQQIANDPNSIINKHAHEYELIQIGTLNVITLDLTQTEERIVVRADELITPKEK